MDIRRANRMIYLGFEGPPGVGKTSLAKEGIAKCLLGANGTTRPFAFIAIGGEPNSSTLVGHNYICRIKLGQNSRCTYAKK